MATVYMMIGLPGSGKSTFAKTISGVYICPDEIRKELYGDISIQGDPSEVFGLVDRRIKEALTNGKNVVYDATNTTAHRAQRIAVFRKAGADRVIGYYINTPFTECCNRNEQRNDRAKAVPIDVMKHMQMGLRKYPPCKEDGFDELYIL